MVRLSILQCGLLLSIHSYQLFAFTAVAQNACRFSSTKNGTCKPFADCMGIHGKIILETAAFEEKTYCCPNNRRRSKPLYNNIKYTEQELNLNHQNPLPLYGLTDNFWNIFKKNPKPNIYFASASKPFFAQGVQINTSTNYPMRGGKPINPDFSEDPVNSNINDSREEEATYWN